MKPLKLLIVDDEDRIRQLLKAFLKAEGFQAIEAPDGAAALEKLEHENFDLLVLDLMMPKMDGWEVCRRVRTFSGIPIIILTARSEEGDRVLGLELGADDYVVKPFSGRELVARVKAVLRRTNPLPVDKVEPPVSLPGLFIEPSSMKVTVNGHPVTLTPKEFALLYILAKSPGRIYTREQLLDLAWGYDFNGEIRTVDVCVNRVREKLGKIPGAPNFISTIWGVGYQFEVENDR